MHIFIWDLLQEARVIKARLTWMLMFIVDFLASFLRLALGSFAFRDLLDLLDLLDHRFSMTMVLAMSMHHCWVWLIHRLRWDNPTIWRIPGHTGVPGSLTIPSGIASRWAAGCLSGCHTALWISTGLIRHLLHHVQTPGSIDMGWMADDTAVDTGNIDIVTLCLAELFSSCFII